MNFFQTPFAPTTHLYAVSNPTYPGLVKIGETATPKARLKSLSNPFLEPFTAIYITTPLPFGQQWEKATHATLDAIRVHPKREYFHMTDADALALLKRVELLALAWPSDQPVPKIVPTPPF